MTHSDVFIVGAGPTGLALALWLRRHGVAVRIVDKTSGPGTTSRALAVQARTLELYRQLGLGDVIFERAHRTAGVNFWVRGERTARVALDQVGQDLTPYPSLLIFPQDQHERLLIERLNEAACPVERNTEVLELIDGPEAAGLRLRKPDGGEEICTARFVAGCDGARSIVREAMDASFPGGTYRQMFYVADVQAKGPPIDGELHVDLDQADFLAVFPLAEPGHARLVGAIRDDRAAQAGGLQFADVSQAAVEHLKVEIEQVNWFSTYRVHHRVADRFRKDRLFLLGDAAHIHSPVGGQGMNTGIGDAVNLAWKLAAVLQGSAPDRLLDTYQAERIEFARRLVATTDRVFSFASVEGPTADLLRTRLAPFVIPRVASLEAAREYIFRTVSQITLNYRRGPLSQGAAGAVHGGDRLPWAPTANADNFASLIEPIWQVHVYGRVQPETAKWCAEHRLPVRQFEWCEVYEKVWLARDAVYLIRPDTYVALADHSGSAAALERYFKQHGLRGEPMAH